MSSIQDNIYPWMPVFVQNLMISAFGYYWQKRRFGGIFEQELKGFRARELNSEDQWNHYQNLELHKLLIHAYQNVPYYKEKLRLAGFSDSSLEKIEISNLRKLPFLSKEELRNFGTNSLLSNNHSNEGQFYLSSGSTGTPTKIFFSRETHQKWSAAFEARIRNWAGINKENPRGMIGGRRVVPNSNSRGPYFRYNLVEKQIYFSAYHISSQTASGYAEALNKYKVEYMTGYAMSNFLLANHFHDLNIEVPTLKAVITSSEKLTREMRQMFYKVYGCKTYDSYSGVEACGLISENEYGQLLISPDVGIMEVLNDKGEPCKPGEVGEIYSTGFLNYDQPLIRYRIGDKVRLAADQKTKCGRNMVVVDEIIGRYEDMVTGPDGRQMVRFHGLYIDIPGLVAGQLVQHTTENYTINLQVDNRFDKNDSEKLIKRRLISQLGEVAVRFEYPEKIPLGPNGKFKAVISELTKPF